MLRLSASVKGAPLASHTGICRHSLHASTRTFKSTTIASRNVKSERSYLSHDKPSQNKTLFDRESSFSSRPRSSSERSSGNHRQEYPPRSSSYGTYRNDRSSGSSHARDRPQLTPSQTFMEERNKALASARFISDRNARKAERERSLLKLAMKKSPDASPTTYQKPVVAGDISELFAPGSTQDREVHPGDFVEIRR